MQMIRSRLSEVLGKYAVKLADAPLDALTLAVEHILRANQPNTPQLGLATTGQLIDEIKARIEIHALGGLEYRTVDGEKFAERETPLARVPAKLTAKLAELSRAQKE